MTAGEFREFSKKELFKRLDKMNLGKDKIIYFSEKELKEIEDFAKKVVQEKMKEEVHQKDCGREVERWMNGYLGEKAVEKFLGVSFSDKTVGKSKSYSFPDLESIGYKVGVKTCRFPNFPTINRDIHTPQIFVMISGDGKRATILGLADVNLLKENLDNKDNDDLVYAKSMLERKTAFSMLTKLKQFKSLEDLKDYKK